MDYLIGFQYVHLVGVLDHLENLGGKQLVVRKSAKHKYERLYVNTNVKRKRKHSRGKNKIETKDRKRTQ
jgi:hypothetical protein